MKLSDYKNEEALDLIADIIEPVALVFSDQKLVNTIRTGRKIDAVKMALKNHSKQIIEILARIENVPVAEYKGNIASMTVTLLDIFNDEELTSFFTSQAQTTESNLSTPPMGNTQGKKN